MKQTADPLEVRSVGPLFSRRMTADNAAASASPPAADSKEVLPMSRKDSIATVEREVPDIIDLPAELTGPWRMESIDPVAELQKFEAAAELQSKLLPASVKRTLPEDWIDQGGKAYLQGIGVERLAPLWGLWFGRYTVEKEAHDDGSYSYVVTGPILSKRTGVLFGSIVGGRSSSDPFFDEWDEKKPAGFSDLSPGEKQAWKAKHRIAPDPLEVRKAAVTNWQTRGASMLMGMRGLTVDYLKTLGIVGIRRVEYGAGAKGGATAPADLKARRTELWNDILKRTGGDPEAAHSLLKETTAYAGYKNKTTGKDVPGFAGATNTDNLSDRSIDIAEGKIAKHHIFGDEALAKGAPAGREPGDE
jgi:hypothetical protein